MWDLVGVFNTRHKGTRSLTPLGWLSTRTLVVTIMLRDQYFHFFSWLLAGNSYMVTAWWWLTYTLIYLLVTRPPLTILTWPLESRWLFTNTCSCLQWRGLVGFPPRHPSLFIVLHDLFLVMHYWSAYCLRWLRTAHYCTLLRTVTPIVHVTLLFSYSI